VRRGGTKTWASHAQRKQGKICGCPLQSINLLMMHGGHRLHLDHLSYVQGVEAEDLSLGTTNTATTATTTATTDKWKTRVQHQGEDAIIVLLCYC
jgi:hypothetical protein